MKNFIVNHHNHKIYWSLPIFGLKNGQDCNNFWISWKLLILPIIILPILLLIKAFHHFILIFSVSSLTRIMNPSEYKNYNSPSCSPHWIMRLNFMHSYRRSLEKLKVGREIESRSFKSEYTTDFFHLFWNCDWY